MKSSKHNNVLGTSLRGAFGRIAQPYSGAASRGEIRAKVERGGDFQLLASAR